MSSSARTTRTSGQGRRDLPLFIWTIVASAVAGVVIYAAVDAGMPDESVDSNSPNAVTPGPGSSFNVR